MKTLATGRKQHGLSLVELMIAMVLGLILMAGVVEIYLSSRASYRLTDALSEVQENGRFATNFIVHDARMAGYSGCNSDVKPTNALDVSDTDPILSFQNGVQGYQATGTAAANASWAPSLPDGLYTNLTNKPIPGTDVLSIRTVQDDGVVLQAGMPDTSANMDVSGNASFTEGDILLLSDCSNAAVFQVTGLPSGKVQHNTGNDASPGNKTKKIVSAFQEGASISKINTFTYFIASRNDGTNCDDTDVGTCGLWRTNVVNVDGAATVKEEELVSGVTDMQVLYGEDTDGNGTPDGYVDAGPTVDWGRVVSIKIALLVESTDTAITKPSTAPSFKLLDQDVTPPNDLHLRQVFTTTIALRNKQLKP